MQTTTARWITVRMPRHADFGGGTVEADLPDTPAHRAMYAGQILREWTQEIAHDQTPDIKPGAYFVTCIDGPRVGKLAGPFVNDHAAALAMVDRARAEAERVDPRAIWYAFGTCRLDFDHPQASRPGVLNAALGIAS